MAVSVQNIADPTMFFEFTCPQWGMMTDASKAEWTVTENTCGVQTTVGNPYAASDFLFTLNGVIAVEDPLTLSVVDGVYTIGVTLPQWYTFKGTISGNKVVVTGFTLPTNGAACYAIVRRQQYHFTDDFTIDTGDNSINFAAGLGLNGQVVYVRAFV